MFELEMNYEPGHLCKAFVISLSAGLDVVLIDDVEDSFEPSLFRSEERIKQACEELLNEPLHGIDPHMCTWHVADLTREHYGICSFDIDVDHQLGDRVAHFRRWREDSPEHAHELFEHLQLVLEKRMQL